MKLVIKLLKLIKVSLFLFVLGSLILITANFLNKYTIFYLQIILDEIISPIKTINSFDYHYLLSNIINYLLLLIVSLLMIYLGQYLLYLCSLKITNYIRNKSFIVLHNLPISYFDNNSPAKIASKVVNDVETLRSNFYDQLLVGIFQTIIQIIVIIVIAFFVNKYIALFYVVLLPIYIIIFKLYNRNTSEDIKEIFENNSNINSLISEASLGNEIIKVFNQESTMINNFEKLVDRNLFLTNRWIKFDTLFNWSIQEFLKQITIAFVVLVVGYYVFKIENGISIGLIFIFIKYSEEYVITLSRILRMLPQIRKSLTSGMRILEFLEYNHKYEIKKQLKVSEGKIEFKNVCFEYVLNTPVLKDINFDVNKGETLALIGHTGSGKSSIINLLCRFYDVKKGQILIDGQNIIDYDIESVRKNIAIVLQDPYIFKGTIASNISMNDPNIKEDEVIYALKSIGADYMLKKFDKGIHFEISKKGTSLSTGERQLIAFARALVFNPKILILDEATSNIDTETEKIIQKALDILKKGRTTIIIAHRLSTIKNADKIILLKNGSILEMGKHQELINNKNSLYYELNKK